MATGGLTLTPELILTDRPDRLLMLLDGLQPKDARRMAEQAVREARRKMPKSTGAMTSRITPAYGINYFGIKWSDPVVWFQEQGIRPFTMRSLAGKTIPMWIDDPTGRERARNPKARTRTTVSGKVQVLIFRKAVRPGAPGRISRREAGAPYTTAGRRAGAIQPGNGGVKWRHPGLSPRQFMNNAMTLSCQWNGLLPTRIYVADARWRGRTDLAVTT